MMKKIKTYIVAVLLILGMGLLANDDIPKPMKPVRLVNDYAKVFSSSELRQLEQKLIRFDSQTSTQIAIVTMKDLKGYAPQDMATRIMEAWGVGGKDDNGFVILFKPKTASSNGQVFITTGYGVEQFVTDALAKKVVEYDMIPNFKNGNVFKGMDVATSSLMSLTTGEFSGSQYLENRKKSSGGGFPWFFFLVFFVFPILFGRRRRNVSSMSGRGSSLPFWLLLGSMGSGRSHGGSFGNFNSGGGSFGGFGGGFGGGGGAGGSW